MKVAVAGASGFIGSALLKRFERDSRIEEIYALSRSRRSRSNSSRVTWRQADLADLEQTREGIRGATHAIYLIHSMSPQARLSQGSFDDFDLHQADNFARACREEGISEIFYLGGLLPNRGEIRDEDLSDHLRSRLEVERVLAAYGARVTAFRAGLIIGPGGSSTEMLFQLVRRLPVMAVPIWTRTVSEPVDMDDTAHAIHEVLFREDLKGATWDLSCGLTLSYQDLMIRTAAILGLKRILFPVPILSPSLSRLWVSLITGAPRALVYPLVKSLTHPMLSRPQHRILEKLGLKPTPIEESLRKVMNEPLAGPPAVLRKSDHIQAPTVRSIQRFTDLPLEKLKTLGSLSERYFLWLPQFLVGIIRIEKSVIGGQGRIRFELRGLGLTLLELHSASGPEEGIERFRIMGGWLQRPQSGGYLEFRSIPSENCVLAVVQDFVPKLPWPIYRATQAVIHLIVMFRFGVWLRK